MHKRLGGIVGLLIGNPEILTRGFVYKKDAVALMDSIKEVIIETLKKKSGDIEQDIKRNIRSVLKAETKRRTMIFLSIHEI